MIWLRNKLLSGLALALPLVITFAILQSIYGLLHGWSAVLVNWCVALTNEMAGQVLIAVDDPRLVSLTRFIGFLIPLLALIALGVMATNVIGVHIVSTVDRLLLRVPFVSFIYKSLKQVIDSFKTFGGPRNFNRVVYVDYPVPGMKIIAFVTSQFTDPGTGKAMTTVFVPIVPAPMSGFLLVVDSEKVTDCNLSLEDSMKLVFSAGLIAPNTSAVPLNQKPATDPTPLSSPVDPEFAHLPVGLDGDEAAITAPPPSASEPGQPLPIPPPLARSPEPAVGLPRAEDFDSGDPDILADAEQQAGRISTARRVGNRIASALPWRRR
jgi:uncharacterized membrane protein